MIANISADIVAQIGKWLPKADRNKCHLAAKCFQAVSYDVEEFTIKVCDGNFSHMIKQDFVAIFNVVKKRMPKLKYVKFILMGFLTTFDVSDIVQQIRAVFSNIQFKLYIQGCFNADKVIATFPDGTDVYLTITKNMHGIQLDPSYMKNKTYSFLSITTESNNLMTCKEIMDSVKELAIDCRSQWLPIDLSIVDPHHTRVSVKSYSFTDIVNDKFDDLCKINELFITYWTTTSIKNIAIAFLRGNPDFKNKSFLRNVCLETHDSFASDHFQTLLDILPQKCKVSVSNVFMTASLYLVDVLYQHGVTADLYVETDTDFRAGCVIRMLTKRDHKIVFARDFSPSRDSYDDMNEIWEHMTNTERCKWGMVKYLLR